MSKKRLYPVLPPDGLMLTDPLSPTEEPSENQTLQTESRYRNLKLGLCQNPSFCEALYEYIDEYIDTLSDICRKLEEMKAYVKVHHWKTNVAKTSCTVMSGAGVATVIGSLCMAPVTGATSLLLGAGGAVMTVTGSVTNVVTDYMDYRTSNLIMEEIIKLLEEKKVYEVLIGLFNGQYDEEIKRYLDEGLTKEEAQDKIIQGLIQEGSIKLETEENHLVKTLSTIVRMHRIEAATLEALPYIEKTLHVSDKSFQFIYNILGLTGKSAPHIVRTIMNLSGIFSVAFTVIDIGILVKDWRSEHPSVEKIEQIEDDLNKQKSALHELLEFLEGCLPDTFDKDKLRNAKHSLKMKTGDENDDLDDSLSDFVIVDKDQLEELCDNTNTNQIAA